jgi:hypothetical protein
VTSGNIENFMGLSSFAEFSGHDLGRHLHQRHHGLRKLYPIRIFGLQHVFAQRRSSSAHRLGQPSVTLAQTGCKQKPNCVTDICGRMLV